MAKMEIIIDGVDVSKCEWFINYTHLDYNCNETPKSCYCKNKPNCYYKQLQRKLQANKNLNDHKSFLQKDNDRLMRENSKLREILKIRMEDLCDSCGASSMMPMPCKLYEDVLNKIKHILVINKEELEESLYHDYDNQILTIINGVLDEDESE